MSDEKLLTISEVTKYLKIPKSTIYKLSQRGDIPSCKIGKQLRFRKSTLDSWLHKREGGLQMSTRSSFLLEEPSVSTGAKTRFVLIIDDDELVLKTLSKFLKVYGYGVEPVNNGEQALKKVEEADFDLIIADVRMPGMDGLEAIKKIREINTHKNKRQIPEIIITGYMDSTAQQEALSMGVSDYIHKPFFISELLNAVKQKIDSK